mmetsp:Transcript_36533/g.44209  ORF Transcript_36533/g.44209 Transcript_36533/m.44209 type:complete len:701 (-) Transcript_36533:254-2356(-)|eukprot:CAMPEP_0197855380 /NCGR_PEP_ID=MMETSP1438-20131217/26534_1 /TAXON_ID=1461541 /ORGANISM="Pterosperma sp., Strain CCMP1384" /LENGTH=700 /DNA_ID=CAMNT_0043470463 /DNA_START=169 /DNA_END=2271 /DNA_ORIENTATION=+
MTANGADSRQSTPPLPPLELRNRSASSNGSARLRKHTTGTSNVKSGLGFGQTFMVTPPPAGTAKIQGKPTSGAETSRARAGRRAEKSAAAATAAENLRKFDHIQELASKASPYTFKRREDAMFLKKVGDKLYGSSRVRLRELFMQADVSGDGKVSYQELSDSLARFNFGLTAEQMARLAVTVDMDRSGEIDYDEFMDYFESFTPLGGGHLNNQDYHEDRMMTYAPWECIKRPVYKVFDKTIPAPVDQTGTFDAGSYEEQKADYEVLKIVANKFAQNDSKLRLVFRRFDVNKDGQVSLDEFRVGLRSLNMGLTDPQIERFMAICDQDKSGMLNYEEFLNTFGEDLSYTKLIVPPAGTPVPDHPTDEPSAPGSKPTSSHGSKDFDVAKINTKEQSDRIINMFKDKLIQNKGKARAAFKQFDVNGDGYLSHSELQRALSDIIPSVTHNDTALVVSAYDPNNDGYLNYREFIRLFEDDEANAPLKATRKYYGDSPIPITNGPMAHRPKTAEPSYPGGGNITRTTSRASSALPHREPFGSSRPNSLMGSVSGSRKPSVSSASANPITSTTPYLANGRFSHTPAPSDQTGIEPESGCPSWQDEGNRLFQRRDDAIRELQNSDRQKKEAKTAHMRQVAINRAETGADKLREKETQMQRARTAKLDIMLQQKRRYTERSRLYDQAVQANGHDLDGAKTLCNLFMKHSS